MGLEVDHSGDLPIPSHPEKEPSGYYNVEGKEPYGYHNAEGSRGFPPSGSHRRLDKPLPVPKHGQRFTVSLGVALAVMTVLAAVAAGVAGSLAVKRDHQ